MTLRRQVAISYRLAQDGRPEGHAALLARGLGEGFDEAPGLDNDPAPNSAAEPAPPFTILGLRPLVALAFAALGFTVAVVQALVERARGRG